MSAFAPKRTLVSYTGFLLVLVIFSSQCTLMSNVGYEATTRKVEFRASIQEYYRGYFNFEGRISRAQYWNVKLFVILVYSVLGSIMGIGFMDYNPSINRDFPVLVYLSGFFICLFALINFMPSRALSVRRYHDMDLSGGHYLGHLIILFFLLLIPYVNLLAIITWYLIPGISGSEGANKYGPNPLSIEL